MELVRQLLRQGVAVEGADFLRFPLGRFCSGLCRYHRLPSPRHDGQAFELAWVRLLQRQFTAVFACNEEIFWLAGSLSQPTRPTWSDLQILQRLHRKDSFVDLLQEVGLPFPRTLPLTDSVGWEWAWSEPHEVVVKPVYSRFGESTWVAPSRSRLLQLRGDSREWLVQQRLPGATLCSSAFAWQGEVLVECAYACAWGNSGGRGHTGAGLHFRRVDRPDLLQQVQRVVSRLNYSGPLGLDFVGDTAVECNPRWTSGIHLLDCAPLFAALGLGDRPCFAPAKAQLVAPMLLKPRWSLDYWRDLLSTPDVLARPDDTGPFWAQFLCLAELGWRCLWQRLSLTQSTTWDIEWNGH